MLFPAFNMLDTSVDHRYELMSNSGDTLQLDIVNIHFSFK
jgi:hypothetical protein